MHLPDRLRSVANVVNLSTPAGLVLACAAGARPRRGAHGLWLAEGYRWRFPVAGAFTVGDVVLTRHTFERLAVTLPDVLHHERAHARQYALLGVWFAPAYAMGAVWSLARTGHPGWAHPLERHAGLVSGGYADASGAYLGERVGRRGRLRRGSERSGAARSGSPGGAGADGATA